MLFFSFSVSFNDCLFLEQTMIRTPIYAMGRNPELFDDPLKYKPERWLRDDSHKSPYHAFATLPFGFGTRMCLGKYIHADCKVTTNVYLSVPKMTEKLEENNNTHERTDGLLAYFL